MTDGDPAAYLDDVVSRYYDENGGDEEDGGYWFNGELFVRAGVCREISKAFYVECAKLGAVRNA